MLNWARTANPTKWDDFHYVRWIKLVGGEGIMDAIKKANDDQLNDLYILREELRLGI